MRRVLVGLLFFAVLTAWRADRAGDWAFEAGVFALAAVWAVWSVRRTEAVGWPVVLAVPAGAAAIGCLQLFAGTTVYRFETVAGALEWGAYFAVAFLAAQLYREHEARAGLRHAMVYFAFVVAVVSVMQLFTAEGKVFWLFPTKYTTFVMGPFVNRDHYSCFIELALPAAVVEALSRRRNRAAYAAMAATMFASVIAGASRAGSAIVMAEVAVLAVGWGQAALPARRRRASGQRGLFRGGLSRFAALAVMAAVFTAVVGWEVLWQRFQEKDPYKFRADIAMAAIDMGRARPAAGFGLGTFQAAYRGYETFDSGMTINHAHNDWLEWLTEGGWPLAGLMAFAALWSVRAAWRSPWALGVPAVFVHGLVDYPLHTVAVSAWLFAIAGAAAAASAREKHAREDGSKKSLDPAGEAV